jgi:WD40 repeat protein
MIQRCCFATLMLLLFWASSLRADDPPVDAFGDPLPPGAIARLGTVRWRSTNWGWNTEAGIFTADGERFITWGGGQAIEIFDVATGRRRQGLSHRYGFYSRDQVALAPDGKTLVAASGDAAVRIWDLDAGRATSGLAMGGEFNAETSRWQHSVMAAGFLGRKPVFARVDYQFDKAGRRTNSSAPVLCDARTGAQFYSFPSDAWAGAKLAFSPDGMTFAVLDTKEALHLFDGENLKKIQQWDAGASPFYDLRFSRDGSALAILYANSQRQWMVRVWSIPVGKKIAELALSQFGEFAWAPCVAISALGKQLALGPFKDRSVRILEASSGKEMRQFISPNSYISHLAFSPDDRVLLANSGSALLAWDTRTGKARHAGRDVHWRGVQALAFSLDGRTVATADGHHTLHRIHLWDASTGTERLSWEVPDPSTTGIYALSFSPDGRRLASCEWHKTRLWDVKSGKFLHGWKRDTGFNPCAAFSPDGKVIALVEPNHELVIRAVDSGKEIQRFVTGKQMIGHMAFSPDSRLVAAAVDWTGGQDAKLLVCDRSAGKMEVVLKGVESLRAFHFSPNGRQLWVLVPEMGTAVWDLTTRQKREFPLAMRRNNVAASFAPTGRLMALASAGDRGEDPVLSIRELASNAERFRLPTALGFARPIAFSQDGRRLASAHPDTTVLIWNLDTMPEPPPEPKRLSAKELAQLWEDLAAADAERGHRAIRLFSTNPAQALPFLRERLKPVPPVVPQRVVKLIADLDSDQFRIRQHALDELARWDEAILDDLQEALRRKLSVESRRRLEQYLKELTEPVLSSERLRTRRAIEFLEQIATPEARTLLRAIAAGQTGALRTQEAKMALERLDNRATDSR